MPSQLTRSIAEAATEIGCSVRFLADGLRAGRFPGRKMSNQWRLTDEDIAAVVDICRATPVSRVRTPAPVLSFVNGLTERSRNRPFNNTSQGGNHP